MKKIFSAYIYVLFMGFTIAYGQEPNSVNSYIPDVSSKSNSSNYTTDYYSGRLIYSASLSTVGIYGLKFPIVLNYNGSGNRVQAIAGATGLGWTLALGGQITRAINGLPDESTYGYCGSQRTGGTNYGAMNKSYIQNITNGTYDSQPDQFSFSFLGFQGSFVLDPDGNPLLQSNETGLRVVSSPFKRGVQSTGIFILQDQQGNQYFFNGINTISCVLHGETSNTTQNYVGGWYLTKILTPSNQEIDLTYSLDNIQYTNYLNMRHVDNGTTSCLSQHSADLSYNENQDISTQQVNLTSISGNGITVNLGYGFYRADVANSRALTDISVSYNLTSPIQYKLNYGYFTSTDGTNTQRLKLSSISEVFAGGVTKTPYTFSYNETVNLPARNSIKTDLLGLYNNNSTTSNLIGYGDKTPDLTNSQANILKKVTNLSGGSINFDYELNTYTVNNQVACGLRIKDVYEIKSATDPTIINGEMYNYNIPGSTTSSGQLYSYAPTWGQDFGINCTSSSSGGVNYFSSETFQSITDANGVNVGYSNVAVVKADGSSIQYKFTNFSDYPDQAQIQFYADNNSSVTFNPASQTTLNNVTNNIGTSYAFARGKTLKEDLINSVGQTIKTTNYIYSLGSPTGSIVGIKSLLWIINVPTSVTTYQVTGYNYFNQDLLLTSKTVQDYRQGVAEQNLSESYTYCRYASNLLRSRIVSASGNKTDNYYLRYPFDVIPSIPASAPPTSEILTSMTFNNIISSPVEVVHTVVRNSQETVVSANVTEYAMFNSTYLPSLEYKFENNYPLPYSSYINYNVSYGNAIENNNLDSRLQPFKDYNAYDAGNNLTQSESPFGTRNFTSSIYGYNYGYKIAEVAGAKQNDIAYTSFEMNDQGNWTYSGYPDFDIAAVTGTHTYNLAKGSLSKGLLTSSTNYLMTYWTKNTTYFSITGTVGTPVLLASRNGWNCYQHTISGVSSIMLSGPGIVDEVRLYPAGAKMITSSYIPMVGVSSKNDENNQLVYYNYDEFNRLQYIRDNEKNIIKAFCYNNSGESGNCFVSVPSTAQSGSFYKNDCGAGYVGSQTIAYSVEAGRYSASTQQAADGLALNDVNQNGQLNANANGSCVTAPTITSVSYGGHDNYVNVVFTPVAGCGTAVINWKDLTTNTSSSSAGACTSPAILDILTDHHNYSFTVTYYPLGYTTAAYSFNANY